MSIDFSKIFSINAPSTPFTWTDSEYLEGWDTIQNTPPTRQQFNALQMISDQKALELYNTKAPKHSPIFTGDPTAPTPAWNDNDTSLATTAFVQHWVQELYNTKSPKDSPVFTGDPQAPTPAWNDNDNSIATTKFVKTAIANAMAGTSGGRGWIKFDNKTVIQWATDVFYSGNGIYTINFPITFPTACAAFTAIDAGVSTSGGDHSFINAIAGTITDSSIKVGAYSGTAWLTSQVAISWIAVGY